MADQWHYIRGGQQAGPISAANLKRMATGGQLSPADQVWKGGMENWVRADTIKGLFEVADVMQTQVKIFNAPYSHMDLECEINTWAQQNSVKILNVSISSVFYGFSDGDDAMYAVVVYEVMVLEP